MEELSIAKMTGMHMVAVCRQAYSQALSLGIPPERVHLIPNGVDLKKYFPHHKGTAFRQNNQIPPDALLAGFAGRLSYEKGPDQFVRMAEIVHQTRPDLHFVMVGDGPMSDEIRTMVQRSGLDEVFHLTGWNESMETVYPAFDLFAMTSRIEGMPLAALEAMACGVPTVAMSVGGLLEAIEVGTTGVTSSAEDVRGLANALLILIDDPDRMRRMGEAARQRAEHLFGLPQSLGALSDLFRSLTRYALPGTILASGPVMSQATEVKARAKPASTKRE
jgi:glycosyltransferase involved in cell wall biosynthesis